MKKLTAIASKKNNVWTVAVTGSGGRWYVVEHEVFRIAARIAERRAEMALVQGPV